MIENFEHIGYWWLPENPHNPLYGSLKFIRNEKAILDVMGNFQGNINDPLLGIAQMFTGQFMQTDIIHGLTTEGKIITLYRCNLLTGNVTLPGIPRQTFKIDVIIEGYHFKNAEEIKFKQISVHYSYLNEWVNISGFKRLVKDNGEEELTYKYDKPKNIPLTNNDDYEIYINFDSTHLIPHFGKELNIKQQSYITINALNKNLSFHESYDIIELIQDFLTFGVMEPVYPLKISGIIEQGENSDEQQVNIILCFLKIPDPVSISSTGDMLFSLNDIRDNISFSLTNWLDSGNKIKYIYGLFFSSFYGPIYPENRFLNYIMAIEGYHRTMGKNEDIPKNEHKQRIKEILDSVEKGCGDHRQWIAGRLGHSNEPGLKKRLNELFKDYQDVFGGEAIFKTFVKDSYEMRNTLVHPKGTEHSTVNMKKLYNTTEMLKIAVAICLLNVLGFKIDDIKSMMPKMQRHMFKIP